MHPLYFLVTYDQHRRELENQLRQDRWLAEERAQQRATVAPKRRRRRLSSGWLSSRQAY